MSPSAVQEEDVEAVPVHGGREKMSGDEGGGPGAGWEPPWLPRSSLGPFTLTRAAAYSGRSAPGDQGRAGPD